LEKIKVAILGSGNIGTDLLFKVQRSPWLQCSAFIGRSETSKGLQMAQKMGINTSIQGIEFIENNPEIAGVVFDATSAASHQVHAPILNQLNKLAIDLTPAKLGLMCVPAVNLSEALNKNNINMITCGGQASIPIAYAISKVQPDIEYIEVVSSIASRSAGPATRINLDEYIHATAQGISQFTGVKKTKAILILNPAEPCIDMQTTIMVKTKEPNLQMVKAAVEKMIEAVQTYVPGYHRLVGPVYENGRIVVSLRVRGLGDFLPTYAGNLDIINCAAIGLAEQFAKKILMKSPQASYFSKDLPNE
jgi:acetaldehyde dehydrogenase (acetylating)